jgi:hypothetical protein
MPTPFTFIKGDKIDVTTDYRDNIPVNMYAIMKPILGADGYMLCWPGLTQVATGQGVDRAGIYNERFGEQYRVSGGKFIVVNADGSVDVKGDISGADQATMKYFYSFNTQGVIADGRMWLYDPTTGLNEVTDPDLGDPIDGVWVDGYYFLTDGENIYHTDIDDETSISPLKFATAEFMPDKSLGLAKTQDNKVIVFGRYTMEYFVNDASAGFSFQRVETRAQKIGIVATHAKCEAKGNWFITGGRKEESLGIYQVGLGSSKEISSREVDKILKTYTEPELVDMRMESRTEEHVTFITVHLPNETLVYNVDIGEKYGYELAWSIIKSDVNGDTPYRGINGVFDARTAFWNYGDKQDTKIGKLDNTVFTQYGNMVEWLLYTPFLKLEGQSMDEIEIETLPGNAPDNDATVFFSMTEDGITYGKEHTTDYGSDKDYNKRFFKRRLGYVRDWVGFKFRGATKSRMAFALGTVTHG